MTKLLECGSFKSRAETWIIDPPGFRPPGRTQIIVQSAGRRNIKLDLDQHSSPESALRGKRGLDALAYDWRCFRSTAGADYLIVNFVCDNDEARSCPPAMDEPGHEWNQIYDSRGRADIRTPRLGTADADRRKLEALGL